MRRFINPVLFWAAFSRRGDLVRQIQFLKAENEILRSRLTSQIRVTPQERSRLIRFGKPLGPAIRHLISIVAPGTFLRWLRKEKCPQRPRTRMPGRPRTPQDIEALILRIARESGWGYCRILGELKKLGINSVSRSTVVNILKRAGLETGPSRDKATWEQFIKRHAQTLWACDFLPRRILTIRGRGWKDAYVLVFINIKSRLAWVSPSTLHPTRAWTAEQTARFADSVADGPDRPAIVTHDRDSCFGPEFKEALANREAQSLRLPIRAPNLNAHVERFIQTLQHECLDHFLIFGTRHLDHLLREFLEHYHTERPHQSVNNEPLRFSRSPPPGHWRDGPVACQSRLGGMLRHYHRKAA